MTFKRKDWKVGDFIHGGAYPITDACDPDIVSRYISAPYRDDPKPEPEPLSEIAERLEKLGQKITALQSEIRKRRT